jgi:acyl-CoA dehydrogenase
MTFRAPVSEYEFLLNTVIGFEQIAQTDRFNEASSDLVTAILTEAGKLCDEVMAPLQRGGDLQPAGCGPRPALTRGSRPLPRAAGLA